MTTVRTCLRAVLAAAVLLLAACDDNADAPDPSQPRGVAASDAPRPIDGVVPPDFDPGQALALIETQVGFGPRVAGMPGHTAQLSWMTAYLRERADTLIVQPFAHNSPSTGARLPMTNLFARFRPDASERVLLLAHWDTRSIADYDPDPARRDEPIPGANDGASGTALLMHMADLLSRQPPPIGVDILLVDGEDYRPDEMYLGAIHFARNPPVAGYQPRYAVLVDMIADADPVYPVEGFSAQYAPDVVRRVYALAHELGLGQYFPLVQGAPIQDDHLPLIQAGIPTIDIIDFDYGPGNSIWHTHGDDVNAVSVRGLEAVGTVLTELVYRGG
ncbi:MAG TPA: M28 family peptidase [Longimicrobiales bacterium]